MIEHKDFFYSILKMSKTPFLFPMLTLKKLKEYHIRIHYKIFVCIFEMF